MTKILYDYQKFSGQRYGGISRYFANLVAGVNARADFQAAVGLLYNTNYYISDLNFPLDNPLGRMIFDARPDRIDKWNKQYSKLLIKKNNFDLLHPTYYHPYFINKVKKPYVLTVHDMIYELLPQHFPATERLPEQKRITTKNATGLIAISQSTKNDMTQVLNIPAEKIQMIYHGINNNQQIVTKQVANLPANYLLFVGERANYKNFSRLLQCFAGLKNHYPDLHLICAGGGEFDQEEMLLMKKLDVNKLCTQLAVSDAQLNYLYQQAQVFVFPSLYEGFGYPLLEAFRVGCAIAASNTSSFPEVGGDAVHYFSPDDTHSMYKAIDELLKDAPLRKQYIENGYEQLKHFALEREIEETLNFYTKIIGRQ
jgi:glycosyltransferase involved in cell wall biosynthesis